MQYKAPMIFDSSNYYSYIVLVMSEKLKTKTMRFTEINPNTYEGGIPSGSELVVTEKGLEGSELNTYVLMGFDELGDDELSKELGIENPVYGFYYSEL